MMIKIWDGYWTKCKLEDIRDNIERSHDTVYSPDEEYNSIMTYGGVTNN